MTNSSRRKWLRFSVRKLLIFVTILALFFAWFSHLSFEYRRARSSANIIQAAGGTVVWSPEEVLRDASFPFIAYVDLRNCELTDDVYAALGTIPDYFMLHIDSEVFDQEGMSKLVKTEFLSGLYLEPGPVAETTIRDFQEQRRDIVVTVGFLGGSSYREYPRLDD